MNKKYSKIISIIPWICVFAINSFDIDKYIPNFTLFLGLFALALYSYDIYKSIKYLKNIPINEIRIRSNNDGYFHVLPFIFGTLLFAFTIIAYFINITEKGTLILLFIIGIMIFFKGFFFIPTAIIKFENGKLNFENGKEINSIQIEEIENITLAKNDISLKLEYDKNYIFSHLELSQDEIKKLTRFLKKYFGRNIKQN